MYKSSRPCFPNNEKRRENRKINTAPPSKLILWQDAARKNLWRKEGTCFNDNSTRFR